MQLLSRCLGVFAICAAVGSQPAFGQRATGEFFVVDTEAVQQTEKLVELLRTNDDRRAKTVLNILERSLDPSPTEIQEGYDWLMIASLGQFRAVATAFSVFLLRMEKFGLATNLLRRAGADGSVVARTILASMYLNGRGVPKDPLKAAELYRSAAEKGDPKAQLALGSMLLLGNDGITKDISEGMSWVEKSAVSGNFDAQVLMAQANYFGWYHKRDLEKAYMWLVVASPRIGNPRNTDAGALTSAWKAKRELERQLSSDQSRNARRLAEAWIAEHEKDRKSVFYFSMTIPLSGAMTVK